MKKLLFLMILCTITFNGCNVETGIPTSIELNNNEDNLKIQKLVQELKDANLEYPKARRWKFWDKLITTLYSDACGYSWGRKHNLAWQCSLVADGVSSLVSIFSHATYTTTTEDYINLDHTVQYTTPINQAEIIGNTHNEAIVKTVRTTPKEEIQINESLISKVEIQVNECLEQYTSSTLARSIQTTLEHEINTKVDFPAEMQTDLITFTKTLAQENEIENIHELAKELLPTEKDALDLLEQYVIRLGNINDKNEIRTFTIQLNQAIDELSISTENVEYLKTIIAIAENSYSLWNIEE